MDIMAMKIFKCNQIFNNYVIYLVSSSDENMRKNSAKSVIVCLKKERFEWVETED